MYKREHETGGGVPSWLVLDARHRSHYLLGTMPPGWTPKKWFDGGYLKRSDTLTGLAQQCRMDPTTLDATIERFNRFAAAGVDEDFHRGEGAHERYQGDPRHRPNPCLGPLDKPPFYAIHLYPGDVGTSGGLLCNEHSQVLSVDGDVMPGLYAAGNVTATVMGRDLSRRWSEYRVVGSLLVHRSTACGELAGDGGRSCRRATRCAINYRLRPSTTTIHRVPARVGTDLGLLTEPFGSGQ